MAVADCVVVVVAGASVVEVNGEYGARAPGVVMETLVKDEKPPTRGPSFRPARVRARACRRSCAPRAHRGHVQCLAFLVSLSPPSSSFSASPRLTRHAFDGGILRVRMVGGG